MDHAERGVPGLRRLWPAHRVIDRAGRGHRQSPAEPGALPAGPGARRRRTARVRTGRVAPNYQLLPGSALRSNVVVLQSDDGWEPILLGEQIAKRAATLAGLLERELKLKRPSPPAMAPGEGEGGRSISIWLKPRRVAATPPTSTTRTFPPSSTRANSPASASRRLRQRFRGASL